MKRIRANASNRPLEKRIVTMRGERVILDADLAELYGVSTKRLNEQVRRNVAKFPADFAFQLTAEEFASLKASDATTQGADLEADTPNWSQNATSSTRRGAAYRPWVFTEHGAIMAANILNSPQAVQMSVFVVRAFVKMRGVLTDTRELAKKLAALEQELKGRLDIHEAAIVEVLQRIMTILDPPPAPPEPARPQIGFREDSIPYRVRRKPARL